MFLESMGIIMGRIIYLLCWLSLSLAAGAAGSYIFNLDFFCSSLIAGLTLIANGLIAEWEDRNKQE
jgi:hypothetical protein